MSALDRGGRIADRAVIEALDWAPSTRLPLDVAHTHLTLRAMPDGKLAVKDHRYLWLPATSRQRLGLRPGDRVLLAAETKRQTLVVYFATHHPGVRIKLTELDAQALQQQLRDGGIDVCLIHKVHAEPDMSVVPIAPLQIHVVLPADHPLAAHEHIGVVDLRGEPAILLDHQPALAIAHEMFKSSRVPIEVRWTVRNVETIRSLVARGLGFSLLMGRPSGDRTYEGLPLAYRPLSSATPGNAVVACTPHGVGPTQLTSALIECCRSEFPPDRSPTVGPQTGERSRPGAATT